MFRIPIEERYVPGKSDRAHLGSDIQGLFGGAFLKERRESPSCRNGRNDIDPESLLKEHQVGPISATNKRTRFGPNFGRQKITFELPDDDDDSHLLPRGRVGTRQSGQPRMYIVETQRQLQDKHHSFPC